MFGLKDLPTFIEFFTHFFLYKTSETERKICFALTFSDKMTYLFGSREIADLGSYFSFILSWNFSVKVKE